MREVFAHFHFHQRKELNQILAKNSSNTHRHHLTMIKSCIALFLAGLMVGVQGSHYGHHGALLAAPVAYHTSVPYVQPWSYDVPSTRFTRTDWIQPSKYQLNQSL